MTQVRTISNCRNAEAVRGFGNRAFRKRFYGLGVDMDLKSRIGLAAVILFAPGGFLLGAALGVEYLRRRHAERRAGE